jgi:hypothetical protein
MSSRRGSKDLHSWQKSLANIDVIARNQPNWCGAGKKTCLLGSNRNTERSHKRLTEMTAILAVKREQLAVLQEIAAWLLVTGDW